MTTYVVNRPITEAGGCMCCQRRRTVHVTVITGEDGSTQVRLCRVCLRAAYYHSRYGPIHRTN